MSSGRRNLVVGVVLIVGFLIGLSLVLLGGGDSAEPGARTEPVEPSGAPTSAPMEPGAPLPLDDLSLAAVTELTGLRVPVTATEFLTARLDDDRQLDVTFVLPADAVDAFVADSGLPEPVADQRVVLHSSPLWKLNPEPGTDLRGVLDETERVRRAVELVTEADGTVRARVVITSPS